MLNDNYDYYLISEFGNVNINAETLILNQTLITKVRMFHSPLISKLILKNPT